jgi:hypothetical protein
MKPVISQQYRDIAADVANVAKQGASAGGRTVVASEMSAYLEVLKADGKFTAADKKAALKDFENARLDREARIMLYQETGAMPVDPVRPPIVALYAVAINDAIRNNTDLTSLRALAHGTELVLDDFGGASNRSRARPMATMTASGLSAGGAAGVDNNHLSDVRAALAALKTHIASLGG